jgi:hypothetical protein
MNHKNNNSQVYLPSNAKPHTYYPIETRRQQPDNPPPHQDKPTHRIERYREKEIDVLRRNNE